MMNWRSEETLLREAGQVMAAGIFEMRNRSWAARLSRGLVRYLDAAPLPPVDPGKHFYPAEAERIWHRIPDQAVNYCYSNSLAVNFPRLEELSYAGDPADLPQWANIGGDLYRVISGEIPARLSLGGGAFTHSIPDFGGLAKSGLGGVRDRLEAGKRAAGGDGDKLEWLDAEEELLAALERYVRRAAAELRRGGAAERLCRVFEEQIWKGADDFYSALAIFNFFWYLDDCDSVGRFDNYMLEFYRMQPVERADAEKWLLELWHNSDCCNGWHMILGGHLAPGVSGYSELTGIILGTLTTYRRPNSGILVSPEMPDELWERIFDNFAAGGVNPALYNEPGYLKRLGELSHLGDDNPDLYKLAYGGCTELMFSGCSNVGSIDAGMNTLEILANTLKESLAEAGSWEEFLLRYRTDLARQMRLLLAALDQSQRNMAIYRAQPLRSLIIGDCLERGRDYNDGGARYNGSVINLGGLSNVANSLWAVKCCFDGTLPFGADRLTAALASNFEGFENERLALLALPKFGNGHAGVDALAVEISSELFAMINGHRTVRGDGFAVPGVIMFVTYDMCATAIGATPDGRLARQPVGDSVGPVQGTDLSGPTAALTSCAALPQEYGVGTLVLNLRLDAGLVQCAEGRARLKALLQTYFAGGGLQVQISMADTATLEAALAEPDRFPHLMVRIGGYSEYFNRLSDTLKREVIKRTIIR